MPPPFAAFAPDLIFYFAGMYFFSKCRRKKNSTRYKSTRYKRFRRIAYLLRFLLGVKLPEDLAEHTRKTWASAELNSKRRSMRRSFSSAVAAERRWM